MHKYDELEKLYHKRIILKYSLIIVFIILFVIGFLIFNQIRHTKLKSKLSSKTVQKLKKKSVKNIKKIKNKNKNKNIKIVNKLHFVLPNISAISVKKKTKYQNHKTIKNNSETAVKENVNVSKQKQIKEIKIDHTANLDNIKIIEKTPSLKTLIDKFNITKDFDLAILISKIYFQKNNLTNAQIWALKANNIKPTSYKSWILFANILLREKKKTKAEEILNVYINTYGHNEIIEKKLRSLNDK